MSPEEIAETLETIIANRFEGSTIEQTLASVRVVIRYKRPKGKSWKEQRGSRNE